MGAVSTTDKLAALVEKLVERVERMESGRKERQPERPSQQRAGSNTRAMRGDSSHER